PTADVVDVTPDPRNTAVSQVQITFSEPVSGLALSSLQLTRNGAPVSLAGATLTGPAADGKTYTVGNLAGLTGTVGNYEVRFTAAGSGVQDAAGNVIAADASDTWAYVNAAPTNVSQSPLSATDAVGASRTFTAVYRDNNGATDLSLVYLRVNDYIPIMLDCVYDAVANKLYVRSADGATLTGGFSPGSANVISNGHGSLDCSQTTVTPSGNTLTVDWRISLGQPLAGRNVLYLRARDKGGADTLYQRLSGGTWQITGSRAPAVNSVSPTSASGPAGTAQAF